jgi:CxxC-x17-CxxC domain-containing protein
MKKLLKYRIGLNTISILVDSTLYRKFAYMYRENKGRGFNRGPREMHEVTCADCGKQTEVPFKPDGDRPVYCRECYQKHKPKRF